MRHKEIIIFGENRSDEDYFSSYHAMVLGEVDIQYFTMNQMRVDPKRICGLRPHLIINTSEPDEELRFQQKICVSIKNGQIIDLWS